jgi:hypothetical protein
MSINKNNKTTAVEEHYDETLGTAPTLYLIQFADYDAQTWPGTGLDPNLVYTKSPSTARITTRMATPSTEHELMNSAFLLQHPDPDLNLDQFVRDAITFGYGHISPLFMPRSSDFTSATGGKMLQYFTG